MHTVTKACMPAPSSAERMPPISSRGHASGHLVVACDDGQRVVVVESDLEYKWAIILDADPNVRELKEQVRFDWRDNGRTRTHFFDFVIGLQSGKTSALIVKPAKRARQHKFLLETQKLASQAINFGFVDEVRVLTDECIDIVDLRNARLFRSVREVDDAADAAALELATQLIGAVEMSELASRIGLGPRGFRALVRLIMAGVLERVDHAVISPSSLVKVGRIQ